MMPISRATAAGIVRSKRFLIGDTDGGLQGVEDAGFDRIECVGRIAAVADRARESLFLGADERVEKAVVAHLGRRATMELQQIDVIGAQALEAAREALLDERRASSPRPAIRLCRGRIS